MPNRVVYYIDSDNFGGAEQVLYALLKNLDRNIWNPILIYHPSPGIVRFINIVEKINVTTVSIPNIKDYKDVRSIITLITKLRSIRPSIFHANINWPLSCSYGIIAAYLASIHPIIATQHLYEEIHSRRYRVMQRLVSLMVDCYIAISSDLANQLKKAILSEKKIRVVQNGIDIEYYSRRTNNRKSDVVTEFNQKNLPVILTVARLAKQKGHTYLLKAAARIPEALFVFAGDGPERENLENEAQQLGLTKRVMFLGERKDIPDLLRECDILVQPSLFEGGLALSIMEAMAAGKPVIATDVEGVRINLTNGEYALIVPPADSEYLTVAIKTLISNTDVANRIAKAGKSLAYEKFSAIRMVKEINGIYEDFLRNR